MKTTLSSIEARLNEDIRNCEFKLKCPKQWESLRSNPELPNIRYCEVCAKPVYLVNSEEDLAYKIWRNQCIAIPYELGSRIFEKEIIKSASKPLVGHVRIKQ